MQAVNVRAVATSFCTVQAEVPEHVVERAVLHHQHHDVVDVRHGAGIERSLRGLGEWVELAGGDQVVDGEVLLVDR